MHAQNGKKDQITWYTYLNLICPLPASSYSVHYNINTAYKRKRKEKKENKQGNCNGKNSKLSKEKKNAAKFTIIYKAIERTKIE